MRFILLWLVLLPILSLLFFVLCFALALLCRYLRRLSFQMLGNCFSIGRGKRGV